MRKLGFLFVLLLLNISIFAFENDSLPKKQRMKIHLGIGANMNIKHEQPFKYYFSELNYKWDGIIKDYFIQPKNSVSPHLNVSLEKTMFKGSEIDVLYSIDDLIWMSQERYDVKGIETVNSFSRAVTFEKRNSFINNYLGLSATILKKQLHSSYGVFVGVGGNTFIYARYASVGTNNTDNTPINRVSEGSIVSDFNLNLTFNFGLTFRYKLFRKPLSSQIFAPLLFFKGRIYSNPFFDFPNLNYLTFFSTSILL